MSNQNNDFKDSLKYEKQYTSTEQQQMHNEIMSLLDEYQKNNSFENREFLCYLAAGIYLTYKKLYPQLSIYILFRTKSDFSFIKNIKKEFSNQIKNIDLTSLGDFNEYSEYLDSGASINEFLDFTDIFNSISDSVTKDISAMKIVLDNINFSHPSKGNTDELFSDPDISKLLIEANKNFDFLSKIDDFLHSPTQTGKQYYELKRELLDRIIKITPSEFTKERKPEPSFSELREDASYKYDYYLRHDNFPTNVSTSEIAELKDLANDFRSRIHDPLQFEILRKTLPEVLSNPIITNLLMSSAESEKESLKENGFQAIYDQFYTPFGKVELQSVSNKAHYVAIKGSAFHSGLAGKSININNFFELVDPNDEHDISYYLDILDSTSADTMISPYEIPEFSTEDAKKYFLQTDIGIAYQKSEKCRELMKHIKIKSKLLIYPESIPIDVYSSLETGEINQEKLKELIQNGEISLNANTTPIELDVNEYLLSTALFASPYMNVCSSGHNSFTTAEIHHKKVIGEFSEILRKRDSNTLLRDMLIRKLEDIIENNGYIDTTYSNSNTMKELMKLVNEHDDSVLKLPKDISMKNIINYAEKLRNRNKESQEPEIVE